MDENKVLKIATKKTFAGLFHMTAQISIFNYHLIGVDTCR